jgi:hypothetical protein
MKKAFRLGLVTVIALSAVLALSIGASAADLDTNTDYLSIDFAEETITGLDSYEGYQYSLDGKAWKDIWGSALDVSGLISTSKVVNVWFFDTETEGAVSTPFPLPRRVATSATVKYNGLDETVTVTGNAVAYEYMTGLFTWSTVSDTEIDTSFATAAATLSVRVAAEVGEAFAATPVTVAVPARPAAPSAPTYDVLTDTIKGLTANKMEISGDNEAWEKVTTATLTRDGITGLGIALEEEAETELYVRTIASASAPASHARPVTMAKPVAEASQPTGEDFTIDYVAETLNATDKSDNAKYEYSKDGKTYTALPAAGLKLTSLIPAATSKDETIELSLRAKATTNPKAPASASTPITIPRRPATPTKNDVYYDMAKEMLNIYDEANSDISAILSYAVGADAYGNFATDTAKAAGAKATSVKFKVAADNDEERFASAEFTLTIPARPAKPKPVYNAATDSITGVSARMSWAKSADADFGDWTPFTAATAPRATFDTIESDSNITVFIRTAATGTLPASEAASVTLPKLQETAPTITLKYADEKLVLPDEEATAYKNYEYAKYADPTANELPSNAKWTALPTNAVITSLIPAPNALEVKIAVRVKATSTVPASPAADITIPARSATPTKDNIFFDGKTGKITVKPEGIEYMGTGDYDNVSANAVTPETTVKSYKFRVKATEGEPGKFASAVFTVTVPAQPAAPSAPVYAVATDTITGVTDKMEYIVGEIGENEWTPVPEGIKTLTRTEFSISATTVNIRTKATDTAVASASKPVPVPAIVTVPTATVNFETEKLTISGGGAYEYTKYATKDATELPSNAKWTAITNDASLASLIPAAGKADIKIAVRIKAVTGSTPSPASAVANVDIPAREPTPVLKTDLVYDYENKGFKSVNGYELSKLHYAIGTGAYENEGAGLATLKPTAAQQSVKIRVKAVYGTSFASLPLTVSVVAIPAAPSATSVVWNEGKGQMTGVTTAMQYKIGEGSWASISSSTALNTSVFGPERTADIMVEIRYTATTAKPASLTLSVKVPSNKVAPDPEETVEEGGVEEI